MIHRCNGCGAVFSDSPTGATWEGEPAVDRLDPKCEICRVASWIAWADDATDSRLQIGNVAFYRYPGDGKPLILVAYTDTGTYRFHYADRSGVLQSGDGSFHELDSLEAALAWLRFLGYRFAGPYQIH
jgi:hypothetical protein